VENRKRVQYTSEYKMDVVKMVEEKQIPIRQVSKDLSIGEGTLYKWIRKYGHPRPVEKREALSEAEIKLLQKRLRDVEEERDILKKAMAIFTQPSKQGMGS